MLNNIKIYGIDTETINGQPHMHQIYGDNFERYYYVDEDSTGRFFEHLKGIFTNCDNALLYGFNLRFDLPILFWKYYKQFLGDEHFVITENGWRITILYAQNCFAIIERDNKTAYILDIRNFFRKGSLDSLAEFFNLGVRKLPKPKLLGERSLTSRSDIAYAMRDAEISYKLGLIIRKTDKQFGLDVTFSCASIAEQIFRQKFMDNPIHLPSKSTVGVALLSYHGGRNWYKYNSPVIIKNSYEYDIRSAYAWAMAQLPDFSKGSYIWEDGFNIKNKFSICKVLFKTDYPTHLSFLGSGKYAAGRNVSWITYPELMAIAGYGDFIQKIEKQISFIPEITTERSPLCRFVDVFSNLKISAKKSGDKINAEMYKLILNSLYGKFIQTINKEKTWYMDKQGNVQHKDNWVAAGLFHPFIATLITGIVRARLLETERLSNAYHSSTDSVKTTEQIITGDKLGDWEQIAKGDCIVLRNRLYLHYDLKGNIEKFALHGFRGKKEDLEQAIYDGNNKITTWRMLWPKEAARQHKTALKMFERTQTISIDFTDNFVLAAQKVIDRQRAKRTA